MRERERERGREGGREGERERERERERVGDFHTNVSKMEQRVLLIYHYFVRIVKIEYIFICTLLSDI